MFAVKNGPPKVSSRGPNFTKNFSSFRSKRPEVFCKNFALENGPPSSRGPNFPKNIFKF